MKKGDLIELNIESIAFGGVGVAKFKLPGLGRADFVFFVEQTAPGDIVSAHITALKKNYGEAKVSRIITPSAERIPARCKHFGLCGGCSLQFLAYENQLKLKEQMVLDSMSKIGGLDDAELDATLSPIIGCASPWYYRNKMEYSFGENSSVGLHVKKSYKDIFSVEECFLQSPESVRIARAVEKWAKEAKSAGQVTATANFYSLVVREGKNTGERMVNLVIKDDGKGIGNLGDEFSKFIAENFPETVSVYCTILTIQTGKRTVMREHLLSGKPAITEKLAVRDYVGEITLPFEILPQSFFQPNTMQAQVLYGKILEFAEDGSAAKRGTANNGTATVLDLFCGTGTIGMFFAKRGASVTGIDINESAIENARANAVKNNIKNIQFICKNVWAALTDFKLFTSNFSLLITDPPRAGIDAKPLLKTISLKIPRWIYVSCNPATLARDLKIICAAGYKIRRIQPVDMFPHTFHIETVVLLELPHP